MSISLNERLRTAPRRFIQVAFYIGPVFFILLSTEVTLLTQSNAFSLSLISAGGVANAVLTLTVTLFSFAFFIPAIGLQVMGREYSSLSADVFLKDVMVRVFVTVFSIALAIEIMSVAFVGGSLVSLPLRLAFANADIFIALGCITLVPPYFWYLFDIQSPDRLASLLEQQLTVKPDDVRKALESGDRDKINGPVYDVASHVLEKDEPEETLLKSLAYLLIHYQRTVDEMRKKHPKWLDPKSDIFYRLTRWYFSSNSNLQERALAKGKDETIATVQFAFIWLWEEIFKANKPRADYFLAWIGAKMQTSSVKTLSGQDWSDTGEATLAGCVAMSKACFGEKDDLAFVNISRIIASTISAVPEGEESVQSFSNSMRRVNYELLGQILKAPESHEKTLMTFNLVSTLAEATTEATRTQKPGLWNSLLRLIVEFESVVLREFKNATGENKELMLLALKVLGKLDRDCRRSAAQLDVIQVVVDEANQRRNNDRARLGIPTVLESWETIGPSASDLDMLRELLENFRGQPDEAFDT